MLDSDPNNGYLHHKLYETFSPDGAVQGTGTTIVRITPDAQTSVFFQGQPGLGLTTALGIVRRGFVFVGSLPTTDGTCKTIGQTSLLIIDRNGNQVTTLSDPNLLNGPWDLTVRDQGELAPVFVPNVLSRTVTRINLRIPKNGNPIVEKMTQIASDSVMIPSHTRLSQEPREFPRQEASS